MGPEEVEKPTLVLGEIPSGPAQGQAREVGRRGLEREREVIFEPRRAVDLVIESGLVVFLGGEPVADLERLGVVGRLPVGDERMLMHVRLEHRWSAGINDRGRGHDIPALGGLGVNLVIADGVRADDRGQRGDHLLDQGLELTKTVDLPEKTQEPSLFPTG
jgi:hypothetical protein